eukprot:TRINITY_DN63860_c0_g1_i1.p2 TRINITY_DN63860_c0_g1~~TRINITY_DN63860_c0_g1_i1.p2  ORF type:complete len:113 (+),score=25.80 TRINITY_DN63860_c0_g1_i1:185-523(+)
MGKIWKFRQRRNSRKKIKKEAEGFGGSPMENLEVLHPDSIEATVGDDVMEPMTIPEGRSGQFKIEAVSYTHLRAHETSLHLVCRLLLEKKKILNSTVLQKRHIHRTPIHNLN